MEMRLEGGNNIHAFAVDGGGGHGQKEKLIGYVLIIHGQEITGVNLKYSRFLWAKCTEGCFIKSILTLEPREIFFKRQQSRLSTSF